ncbi:GNAT family N-acetyltransferase [candidate division KSB3 bacterium]|uniref:GNAT family N-acetyltransferase n=1 Tax=candidate division KSB3 bacterium TaxID=2044937 RepID=A0A9D5JSP9_9BACT|nr:GNAT family N-acetyltransferase [candidate division KSB3 bacterium]MBD3323552.1 GNAT family N-acetyltransferase [candidate division KSB3 bacterium]
MEPLCIDIREARSTEDLEHIRRLFQEYAENLSIDLSFQAFETELATLPGTYALPGGSLLLAEYHGQPIGCVALRTLEVGIGEIKRLYVVPAYRGRGVARRLMQTVLARARKSGFSQVRLDTLADMDAARSLYTSLGFREIPPYYHNPMAGAVYMELRLSDALDAAMKRR